MTNFLDKIFRVKYKFNLIYIAVKLNYSRVKSPFWNKRHIYLVKLSRKTLFHKIWHNTFWSIFCTISLSKVSSIWSMKYEFIVINFYESEILKTFFWNRKYMLGEIAGRETISKFIIFFKIKYEHLCTPQAKYKQGKIEKRRTFDINTSFLNLPDFFISLILLLL